jgi:hypothetical protein
MDPKRPGLQGVHWVEARNGADVPAGQVSHRLLPSNGEKEPASHRMHSTAIPVGLYSPDAHCLHALAPALLLNCPGRHALHSNPSANPALQTQASRVAPAGESEFGRHWEHWLAPPSL